MKDFFSLCKTDGKTALQAYLIDVLSDQQTFTAFISLTVWF